MTRAGEASVDSFSHRNHWRTYLCGALTAALLATLCLFPRSVAAQARDRITRPVDNQARVVRAGNIHPMARPEFDGGRVAADTRLERMILVLQSDPAQQPALESLLAAQQNPNSPQYRQWLTPEEFGRRFGVSDADLAQVVQWLEDQGFTVEPVPAGHNQIVFSGTAAQVSSAFQTEIHEYRVNGATRHANVSNPSIPAALSGVIGGVVTLHDFQSTPMHAHLAPAAAPQYTGGSSHYMAPADFSTIYNLAPLYGSSTDGTGQSIAIVARTNIKMSDVTTFRTMFGLPANNPTVVLNGPDPGIVSSGEQGEAELDSEWSGAVAKGAAIQLVVSGSTNTTDGVDLSAQYIVNHNLAPVVSLSFGACEQAMGTAENQFWNGLWQQAAAQGMSVFVSSGDSGAAGCDVSSNSTGTGRAVNGLCSSPYSTCVGGTEFNDTANPAQYWSASNSSTYGSALSYIPEVAWNESGTNGGSGLWSSGGGASSVYAKPAWQIGPGVPADGRRDVPDVSLSAATHDGYLLSLNGQLYAAGGTSASAPSFAGLMALVIQRQGARQGNANPVLYTLASNQSSGGAAVFHDVISGNNSVPGVTGYNAGAGYDLVTGLGSVDANQLVNNWNGGSTPIPSFSLSAPASAALTSGANTTVGVTVSVTGGFNSAVALTLSSLPAGLTASFSPASLAAPGSGSSTLTLTPGATLASGTYNLTIMATGGGLTKTAPLAVTLAPKCTFSLNPTSANVSGSASSSSVAVAATSGCSWTAVSNASWISITGGSPGAGNGTVNYSVAANVGSTGRTGTMTIAGISFTVTQAAPGCTYGLSASPLHSTPTGYTGSLSVTAPAGCTWTAKSNVTWMTITSGASGSGNGTVTYAVARNNTGASRTGTLTVAGYTVTITEGSRGNTQLTSLRR